MVSCLLLLLWIHTISDNTTFIVFFQAISYSVHTICFYSTWVCIILETKTLQVCSKYIHLSYCKQLLFLNNHVLLGKE